MSDSTIPDHIITGLIRLDPYDRLLEAQRLGPQFGMNPDDLVAYIATIEATRKTPNTENSSLNPLTQDIEEEASLIVPSAERIVDSGRYRLRYAPDDATKDRQESVSDAVLCPSCSAPLGIPSIRPIKVTCPACGVDSLIMS